MKLDASLLEYFMIEFLGYGNFDAPVWFIGMEEGGGNSIEEIHARLAAWDQRGRRHAEDLHDFCQATGHPALLPYATAAAPYSPTWCGLIKHLHQHQGLPLESALEYQRTKWLTKGEANCLLNLMPLPSPNVSTWHYSDWSDLPELQSRAIYLKTMVPKRIARLRRVITNFKPQTVICVGNSYRTYWEQLAEGIEGTTFEIVTHPAARSQRRVASIVPTTGNPNMPQNTNFSIPGNSFPAREATSATTDCIEKVRQFFATGKRFTPLGEVGKPTAYPIFIGYARGRLLCLELKEINEPTLRQRIEKDCALLGEQLGHPVRWQPTGKIATGSGILALYYQDTPDKAESEQQWAERLCSLFYEMAKQITEG